MFNACNSFARPLPRPSSLRQRGFTLMELMVVVTLVGIMMGLAVPSFREFIRNSRLTSAANDLLAAFTVARTEAIKRQQNVVVCASANPTAVDPTCNYGAFTGWIVFQDGDVGGGVAATWQREAGEEVLVRHETIANTITVRNDFDGIESFNPTGFANPAGAADPTRNVAICDERGTAAVAAGSSAARALQITATGRPRVSKVQSEVDAALAAIGQTCP